MRRPEEELVLVFAGNYSQAQCWAKEKGLTGSQWIYANSVDCLVGLHFNKYAWVGTYTRHPNYLELARWFPCRLEPNAKDVTNDERIFTDL